MARSNQLSNGRSGSIKAWQWTYLVPAIAGTLTDLAEIDKFVKEQAEAIPLDEAAVLYRL